MTVNTYLYFVAVLCPAEMDRKITDFKYWMRDRFGCKVALKSPAHITLVPPFRIVADQEENLSGVLNSLTTTTKKIQVKVDGFDHFDKRVLFVNVKSNPLLKVLKEETEEHFAYNLGGAIKKDQRKFHPHITIANRDLKASDFEESWKYFSGLLYQETFSVAEVSLLKIIDGKWKAVAHHDL
jgi:2'-5' RNA ligase